MFLVVINILGYCELLFLSLVRLAMCGCNQNIHRYVCKLIGGDLVFISRVDLGLLLLAVACCTTIRGGSFHPKCIVPL